MKKHIQFTWIFAIGLFIVASSSMAQTFKWKNATSNGYSYEYVENDPTHTRFYTLENGMRVILSVNKKEPRIQTYFAVKAGSKTDPANHTGLAHYLEHMLFKGTDKFGTADFEKEKVHLERIEKLYEEYNHTTDEAKRKEIYRKIDEESGIAAKYAIANEYDKIMSALGGVGTNAFTSYEQTVYIEDIPSNVVAQFLDLQAERFRKPILRIFHTELEAVYEEKNRSLDNDDWKAYELLYERLFPNSYGRQTTIGTIEHLKNPSLKAIQKYYDDFYVPNNMGIIMVGDLNPDEVIKMIDEKFSYMQAKTIPPYTFEPEKPLTSIVRETVVGPDAPFLMMAYRADGISSDQTLLLEVIAEMLSNGTAGLFDINLVQKQKVLDIGIEADLMKDYGAFLIYAYPTAGQKLEQLEKLIVEEINKLKRGEFSDVLLQSIANNHKVKMMKELSNKRSVAGVLMDAFTKDLDHARLLTHYETFGQQTKQTIIDFAKLFFQDNYVVVYKQTGVDANAQKVEKPTITPVEVNRDAQSPFLKGILAHPKASITPEFINYKEKIKFLEVEKYPFLYVKNEENELFTLQIVFDYGMFHSKTIDLATDYIQLIGTKTKSAAQISAELYELASTFNFYTSERKSYIIINGLSENYKRTLEIVEDLLRNAVVDKAAFAGLIQNELQDRINNKFNKNAILQGLRKYAEYGKENPFNYVLTDKELKKLKPEVLINEIKTMLSFPQTVLFYGSINEDEATDYFKTFHPAPASFAAVPAMKTFTRIEMKEPQVLFADFNMVQAEIYWVNNSIPFSQEMVGPITMFNEYFGGNMSSIVFQTIRESKALAYSTYARFNIPTLQTDAHSFIAYVGTQADKFHEAIEGMNELIKELPVSEVGFENAKNSLINYTASQRIQPDSYTMSYLRAKDLGFDSDYRMLLFEYMAGTSIQDIQNFHGKYISGQPYTYCVVASDKKVHQQDLEKYGKVQRLSLKEIFGY